MQDILNVHTACDLRVARSQPLL